MVAAIGTFVILFLFKNVGYFWQEYAFIREITYWLDIDGRAESMAGGLICSDDVVYFLTIIGLFLALSILRLKIKRERMSRIEIFGRYSTILGVVVVVSFLSSLPVVKSYLDLSRFEKNTLSKGAQEVVTTIKEDLVVTTYINIYDSPSIVFRINPRAEMLDKNVVMGIFTRFKPNIDYKYVYYASRQGMYYESAKKQFPKDTPEEIDAHMAERYGVNPSRVLSEEEVLKLEDLKSEDFRTVKVVTMPNGKKSYFRYFNDSQCVPSEREVTAGIKRLYCEEYPKVAFITGHNERSIYTEGDFSYNGFISKRIRESLFNQGFDVSEITFENKVDDDIDIIVIADIRTELSDIERENYLEYIQRGGNLVVMTEPIRRELGNSLLEPFGFELGEGRLVNPVKDQAPDVTYANVTKESCDISYFLEFAYDDEKSCIPTLSATYLKSIADKGYKVTPILKTIDYEEQHSWNELEVNDFEKETPTYNQENGEKQGTYTIMNALERNVNGKTQKILIAGDTDLFNKSHIGGYKYRRIANNLLLVIGAFEWLSDGVSPVDVRRPKSIDNSINIDIKQASNHRNFLMWIIPALLIIISIIIRIRRKSK